MRGTNQNLETRAGVGRGGRIVALIFALGCISSCESEKLTPAWSPSVDWEQYLPPTGPDPLCQNYCGQACIDFPACEERCHWLIDTAQDIDQELEDMSENPNCEARTQAALTCATPQICSDEGNAPAPPEACLSEISAAEPACFSPLYFLGWELCIRQCDFVVDRCEDDGYHDWEDCFDQCKFNLGFDRVDDCFQEGLALRRCIAELPNCASYEAFQNKEPGARCRDFSERWERVCQSREG